MSCLEGREKAHPGGARRLLRLPITVVFLQHLHLFYGAVRRKMQSALANNGTNPWRIATCGRPYRMPWLSCRSRAALRRTLGRSTTVIQESVLSPLTRKYRNASKWQPLIVFWLDQYKNDQNILILLSNYENTTRKLPTSTATQRFSDNFIQFHTISQMLHIVDNTGANKSVVTTWFTKRSKQ